ncbi:hypothetical protein, partial [Ureibacillus acetophenoni]
VLQDINDTIQKVGIRPEQYPYFNKTIKFSTLHRTFGSDSSMETLGAETLYQVKTDMGVIRNVELFNAIIQCRRNILSPSHMRSFLPLIEMEIRLKQLSLT